APVDAGTPEDSNSWGPHGSNRREPETPSSRPAPPPTPPPSQRARDSNQPFTQFIGVPGAAGASHRPEAPAAVADPRVTPHPVRSPDTPGPKREIDPGGALRPALI